MVEMAISDPRLNNSAIYTIATEEHSSRFVMCYLAIPVSTSLCFVRLISNIRHGSDDQSEAPRKLMVMLIPFSNIVT